MKKCKSFFRAIFLFFSFFLFSCKTSVNVSNEVNPLDLIDNKSSFYISIPVQQDVNLVQKMIKSNVPSLSDKNALEIAERTQIIYAGLNKKRKKTEIQLAGKCSIPKIALSNVFTKKNGWQTENISFPLNEKKQKNYSVYSQKGFDISFPNEHTAVLGRDVKEMIENFHYLSNPENQSSQQKEKNFSLHLPPQIYEWLSDSSEVRFYAEKPQSFLSTLTGAALDLKLVYVKGLMVTDPKNDRQYLMDLEFEFKNPKLVTAARGVLTLALGLTDSEVSQPEPNHLLISDIKINKEQLYKILVI